MSVQIRRPFRRSLCVTLIALAAPLSTLGAAMAAETIVTARGNEPFWQLEVTDEELSFRPLDGDTIQSAYSAHSAGGVDLYIATGGQPLVAVIADAICVDTMSGMPFPKTALVVVGDKTLNGCGGVPAALLYGDWRIEEIGGTAIVAGTEPTIAFAPDGSIFGNASCNRYFGSFSLTGEGLAISETGTTMMACEGDVMKQEQALLDALQGVQRFEIGPKGELVLVGGTGKNIVAVPE